MIGRVRVAAGRGEGLRAGRGGRTGLAAGEAVDLVVVAEHGDVGVAPDGVDEVVATDARRVAVAGHHDDVELRTDGLDRLGDGQRAAVERVDGLVLEVAAHPPGAADARHDDGVRLVEPHLVEDHRELHHDRADPAARAPDGREQLDLEPILVGHLRHRELGHQPIPSGERGAAPLGGGGIGGSDGPPPSTRSRPARTASALTLPPRSGTRFTGRWSASSTMSAYWPSFASMPRRSRRSGPRWRRAHRSASGGCGSGGRARTSARSGAATRDTIP